MRSFLINTCIVSGCKLCVFLKLWRSGALSVYGCNNTANTVKGLSLYRIPFSGNTRPVAKSRRKKWVSFIQRKRDKWQPSESSVVCSQHFTEDSFEYGCDTVGRYKVLKLKRDEIGITAVPSLFAKVTSLESERSLHLQNREVIWYYCQMYFIHPDFT